jgi:hypothetical protein
MDQFLRPLQRRRHHVHDGNAAAVESTSDLLDINIGSPDRALAEQLNRLSLQERQTIVEEIHGIQSVVKETPQLVREALAQMSAEMNRRREEFVEQKQHQQHQRQIQRQNYEPIMECYGRALKMEQQMKENTTAVERRFYSSLDDPDFLLPFLRAERFQPVNAATRLLNFLYEKENLFGSANILKTITVSDLDSEARVLLRSGYMQILPGRDVAGRAILFGASKLQNWKERVHYFQFIYYLCMLMVEDLTTQRNGVVCIGYGLGTTKRLGADTLRNLGKLIDGLPLRVTSYHYCLQDQAMRRTANALAVVFGRNVCIRYRFHAGTDMEVIYQMMTFGIPQHILPVSVTGELDVMHHQAFIRDRERYEEEEMVLNDANSDTTELDNDPLTTKKEREFSRRVIIVPGPRDVLLGRGRLIQENVGNIRYRNLIETYRAQYDNARKKEKTRLTREIVQKISETGGRFLKHVDGDNRGKTPNAGPWIEVPVDVAREKVSHSFRDKRRID